LQWPLSDHNGTFIERHHNDTGVVVVDMLEANLHSLVGFPPRPPHSLDLPSFHECQYRLLLLSLGRTLIVLPFKIECLWVDLFLEIAKKEREKATNKIS